MAAEDKGLEKVALRQEKETLLITLYAKAGESRLPDSLLGDGFAAQAVSRIDYDFAKLKIDRDMMVGVAMRADIFDGITRDFMARHPNAIVLHLGCGLDSRVFRIDPPKEVRWFDVDYPDELRRRLYPARDSYRLIGASVTDPDWLADVPADRPVMIVAEGLLPYLAADEVPALLNRLTDHFSCGGELAFDAYSRFGLWIIRHQPSIRATGAILPWAFDDPKDIEAQVPRLQRIAELRAYDPEGYDPQQIDRRSWKARATVRVFAAVPFLAKIGRIMRYGF